MEEVKIDIQRVIDELTKRGATQPCSRCGSQSFAIEQDFIALQVQNSFKTLSIGRATIPAAVVACKNCGAITLHALGVLGLLPKVEENKPSAKIANQDTNANPEYK